MSLIEVVNRLIKRKDQETGSFNGLLQRFELLANGGEISHYGLDLFLQTNLNRHHARFPNPNSGFNLLFYTFRDGDEEPKPSECLIGSLSWQIPIIGHAFNAINCQIIIHPNRQIIRTVYVAGLAADNSLRMQSYVMGGKPNPCEETIDFLGDGFSQMALKAGILPYSDLPPSLDVLQVMQGVINLARDEKAGNIREVLGI